MFAQFLEPFSKISLFTCCQNLSGLFIPWILFAAPMNLNVSISNMFFNKVVNKRINTNSGQRWHYILKHKSLVMLQNNVRKRISVPGVCPEEEAYTSRTVSPGMPKRLCGFCRSDYLHVPKELGWWGRMGCQVTVSTQRSPCIAWFHACRNARARARKRSPRSLVEFHQPDGSWSGCRRVCRCQVALCWHCSV